MKYSDFICVNEGFQTSVNLEYDLNIPAKVKGYIPTEQSVRVLGEFLKSFYYSNDTQSRANVLVGPYGRGKSHLLLVLSAITSLDMFATSEDERKQSFAILEELCDKIYSVKYQYDGLIVYIVGDASVDRERIESKIKKFANHPQIIICISDLAFDQLEVLKRIEAISRLKDENVQNPDPHYMEEMEIYEQDLIRRIQSHIDMMFAPRSQYSTYLNCVKLLDIDSQVRLIQTISRICNDCYNLTPVINNEMVNKNVLNAQNIKGRDLVIQQILDYADSNVIPCMDGYGQEVSIFKSVLSRTGLDQNPRTQDAGLNEVLELIHGFIADCEVAKNNFEQLYQTLCAAPYGLRKGIIPILIAYELRQYKEGVIFYFKDKEMELTPSLLANLNEAPANYQLLIEAGTAEKEQYLASLEQIFADNADVRTTSINHIYSVVKSMQNWVRSLPEYTKKFKSYWENGETRTIDAQFDSFRRELMKFEINSRELVFDSFVSIFAAENQLQNCAESIARCKAFFDGHIKNCRRKCYYSGRQNNCRGRSKCFDRSSGRANL